MVQQVKLALVWEREPAILEREKWNERAKRSRRRCRIQDRGCSHVGCRIGLMVRVGCSAHGCPTFSVVAWDAAFV